MARCLVKHRDNATFLLPIQISMSTVTVFQTHFFPSEFDITKIKLNSVMVNDSKEGSSLSYHHKLP